ncbi:hypothetical protein ZWY2020_026500 [Hordeum vulgare]|nr:hypothetical protein ZWY2020_026500 [Hordeum vulgare]
MEDGDGEQPYQFLQSKGNTESKHDSKLGMEDALLDKGSEPLFESDSDIAVDKRTDFEINADLSEAEMSDGLLCDGVINMLRKILDTKETREIVRQKTLKVKNESETCYGQENHQWASTKRYSYLKAAIERTVGDTLNEKVKEDIYLSFQQHMREEGPNTCSKVKNLILEVIQIVTRATCDSEKTLKIDSSANQHNSTNHGHDSEATVKVNSNGDYEEEDEGINFFFFLNIKVPCDWARYLDEARGKYFFYTDDIPTLRLFENEDDNGTEIREQELWRPLGMSSEEYEKKIQMAKNNGPHKRTKEADNIDFNASPELQILGERRWVVEIDNTRVSMEQLGNSFREKGWVESYVINVFCRKLFRDNHPRTSQRHFFFHTASEYFLQKWKNEASRLQWRDRLIKSFIGAGKARDLQLCNEETVLRSLQGGGGYRIWEGDDAAARPRRRPLPPQSLHHDAGRPFPTPTARDASRSPPTLAAQRTLLPAAPAGSPFAPPAAA